MWLEAKVGISIMGWVLVAIGVAYTMALDWIIGFLLIVAIGLWVFSDFLIGYIIKTNHVDVLIDPCPSHQEICVLLDFAGNVDFIKTDKGAINKREFVKYKKEASIINRGRMPLRLINGNSAFLGHEDYDLDIDLDEAEALDQMEGDDIKEIVDKLPLVDAEPKQKEEVQNVDLVDDKIDPEIATDKEEVDHGD